MWRDALRLDQPVQHRSCPVGGIAHKPLRLETEALFCPFDHGPCGADLGLANGAGCLDVNDDAELHVNEIVVGVSKECRPLVSSGPLRRGIGWRDELRDNVAGGATHFQMKTLKHVSTEMALHVLAYNMKRVMRILGV